MEEPLARIRGHLAALYGDEAGADAFARLRATLDAFRRAHPALAVAPPPAERLSQDDVILITYGDQVSEPGRAPLQTLLDTLDTTFRRVTGGVHILPCYPFTSDDGFSVVDYTMIDPALGTWEDVEAIARRYRLMLDAVVNHISASSAWFQAFLRGEPGAEARFITVDPATDLSLVTRPRTHPLLTRFETAAGPRWVWTTFSTDQIDLNFANPEVLLAIVDVLLLYAAHGASLIRLDAIGYLWKEIGTRCIHLPQTHRVVQLVRAVFDAVAPGVLLITETNVPHADNISYLGDGTNEAQLVYQFPLAPLVLHAFMSGNARYLSNWAAELAPPSASTTFFNFLASHDGIGVVPASGILRQEEIAELCARAVAHGGFVSYKSNPDGSQSPYELNITLFDMLSDPAQDDPLAIERFVAANAIMLALQGVPGVYVHSLVGSHNDHEGAARTGRARSINRRKWARAELNAALADPASHERRVFERMAALLAARRREPAFHPGAPQQVIPAHAALFTFLRTARDGGSRMLCVHNVADRPQPLWLDVGAYGLAAGTRLNDLLTGLEYQVDSDGMLVLSVPPYGVRWLRADGG
jgi:sucrose phosphorylase